MVGGVDGHGDFSQSLIDLSLVSESDRILAQQKAKSKSEVTQYTRYWRQ